MGLTESVDREDQIVEMTMSQKQFNRMAVKCENKAKSIEIQCKKCLKDNDKSTAKIHAHDIVHYNVQAKTYRKLSSRFGIIIEHLKQSEQLSEGIDALQRAVEILTENQADPEELLKTMNKFDLHMDRSEVMQSLIVDNTNIIEDFEVNQLITRLETEVHDEKTLEMTSLPTTSGAVKSLNNLSISQDDNNKLTNKNSQNK